jgi:FemAB-related protein (PEP-CTERM system-associated)
VIEQALIQAANEHAEKIGCSHIEYRDDVRRKSLPVRDEKVNMILPLPHTPDSLLSSFSSKLRSQIGRAQRENTMVDIGGENCLDDFYAVFAQNMRDLGTPVYGKSFFREILLQFDKHSKIVIVRMGKRPVAAAFLLGYKDTLEIPWASTIKDVNHLSVNMLLYWEVLKFAIDNQYQYFDFGRSSKDSGTFRFKQQWGAIPKQCYWHYWLKNNAEMPSLNPNNPKYKLVISLWKKLPVSVTKYIGPNIVKNLP